MHSLMIRSQDLRFLPGTYFSKLQGIQADSAACAAAIIYTARICVTIVQVFVSRQWGALVAVY